MLKRLLLIVGLVAFFLGRAAFAADPDSTPSLNDAIGKQGLTWETYYKFEIFVEGGRLGKIAYQNLDKFNLHQDFLAALPQFKGMSRTQIDGVTYRAAGNRQAYTGVLVIHAGDDAVHRSRFSLIMEDVPSADLIIQAAKIIRASSDGERLSGVFEYEALPKQRDGLISQIPALKAQGIGIYVDNTIAKSISYTEAWNSGTLAIVNDQADLDAKVKAGAITAQSIVLAKEPLREIPAIAGVISAVPLTPASHTVLLSQMYGIPVVYYKDAETIFTAAAGRTIFLSAHGNPSVPLNRRVGEYSLDLSATDLQNLAALKTRARLVVNFNPSALDIRAVETLTRKDVAAYGGKASQMGVLMRTFPNNSVSKALGIPLGYSIRFLHTAKASDGNVLSDFIRAKVAVLEKSSLLSQAQVEEITAQIRSEIQNAKFPAADFQKILTAVKMLVPADGKIKLRFRSSSNVEDGTEFNGAGLYDSQGVKFGGKNPDDPETMLKAVIASLYNTRAYMARHRFGVDETQVGMGILVHQNFKDEVGNGVVRLITDGQGYYNYETISMLEELVTHATSVDAAEVALGFGRISEGPFERVDVQQPAAGKSFETKLFKDELYRQLGSMMAKLIPEYSDLGPNVDIEAEFKVMEDPSGNRVPFLKQVRRVPHPVGGRTADGSSYVGIAGKVEFQIEKANNVNAFADLHMPKRLIVEAESWSEASVRAGHIALRSVSFDIDGRMVKIDNPKVGVVAGTQEAPGYKLHVALPSDLFPSLNLEITNSNKNPGVHSLFSPDIDVVVQTNSSDAKIISKVDAADRFMSRFLAKTGAPEEKPAREKVGSLQIKIGGKRPVAIASKDTLFIGEGDMTTVRIGTATITGLTKRPLVVRGRMIGYGANHHQGDESFIFDLYGDAKPGSPERIELEKTVGRYLYMKTRDDAGDEEGGASKPLAYILAEPDRAEKLGSWKRSADPK